MAGIKLGNLNISKMFVGNNNVKKVYYGNIKIFQGEQDNFAVQTLNATIPSTSPTRGRYGMGLAKVGNKIYLFGGRAKSTKHNSLSSSDPDVVYRYNSILIYDIDTDSFTTANATLPQGMWNITCAAVGTKIYLFGGWHYSSYYAMEVTSNEVVRVYDTENDTLTTLNISFPYVETCSIVNGTNIYVLGGCWYQYNGNQYGREGKIFKFDTLTNTIASLGSLLATNTNSKYLAIKVNDKIHIVNASGYNKYIFDLTNDTIVNDSSNSYENVDSICENNGYMYFLKFRDKTHMYKHIWGGSTYDTYPLSGELLADEGYSSYLKEGNTWWIFGSFYNEYAQTHTYPYYSGSNDTVKKIVFD